MNPTTTDSTRPPKSPATPLTGKKVLVLSSANNTTPVAPPPLVPRRPYPLKRSVSAPIKVQKDERDAPPLQVKIYDGFGDDRTKQKDETLNLTWLESTLGSSSTLEEKKEDTSSGKRHRRVRAFSWDGGGLLKNTKNNNNSPLLKHPSTPNTVATEPLSSPESSPESTTRSDDPNCWSLVRRVSWKKKGTTPKRGKPPKGASPPLLRGKFSKKVASIDASTKQQAPVLSSSRSEVHEQVSSCLKNGDYDTALSLSDSILRQDQQRYGHGHASVGIALHNIGLVHLHASRFDMSESIFYQAVLVRKNALGPEHLDVAASLTKLALVRLHLRRFDGSLAAFLEALRITRKHLGYGHSTVAQLQSHIGCVYFEAGEYMAAQATFEDALSIYRDLWASGIDVDGSVLAVTEMLCNIGSIQSKRKNFYGAIASFTEALDLQRRIMREDHPRIVATLDNLGHAFSKNKDYSQALLCYKEMLRLQVAFYGTYNDECYQTAKKQNIIFEKLKKHGDSPKSQTTPSSPALDAGTFGLVSDLLSNSHACC